MKRVCLLLLALAGALAAAPADARAGQCGLPDTQPLWIDFGDGSVPFWSTIFKRSGLIVAASNFIVPPQLREGGAKTVYFDLYLNKRVGTPTDPAEPATIADAANRLFDRAATSSGCATPLIALNELFGAGTTTPWSATNARYRANVLTFLRTLGARGARPFLLISKRPYTGGEAAEWWRQAAQVADLVREVYPGAPSISKQGPLLGSRTLRTLMRAAVTDLTEIGVPASRVGLMLGFQTTRGIGGREGLKPASAWLEVVKLEALAARQVTSELGIASIWSWGWAAWSEQERDPDKAAAACVYLWARDGSLCDGPAAAGPGFDDSLTEGQLDLPRGVQCSLDGRQIAAAAISRLAAVTGDRQVALTALLARLVESEEAAVGPSRALAAERAVVAQRFHGSTAAYRAALAQAHATLPVARAIIADELRREEIQATLPVAPPSPESIVAYYRTYAALPARMVRAVPAPSWLGGQTQGLALSSLAPAEVFELPTGRRATVWTADGAYRVSALGEAVPLGALPLAAVRPAVSAALVAFAREDAFQAWLAARETAALRRAICLRDELPAVGAVELTAYLPFLAL